ncbi:MAG: hypothetical protein WCG16_08580 [Methylococcales bacterium]
MISDNINYHDSWYYSSSYNCTCKLLEVQTLWGQTVCQVWLPAVDTVVRVPRSDLKPLKPSVNAEQGADGEEALEEFYDLDAQEQLDELLKLRVDALHLERVHVETLLNVAQRCEQAGPDAKAEVLFDWFYKLQTRENDLALKLLIFTEFVPTQTMLKEFLEERGSRSFTARRKAIESVGLPEVRQYRLAKCDTEEKEWYKELKAAKQIVPELRPLLILHLGKDLV